MVNGVQAAYPVMRTQGYGHIVNTASMAGLCPAPMAVSYAATKHAVVGLSTSLRIEAAEAGLRVSVLCPGFIRTPILRGGGKYGKDLRQLSPEQQDRLVERSRPMEPADFARRALNAVARNQAIIIVPGGWKLLWWLNRLSPGVCAVADPADVPLAQATAGRHGLPAHHKRAPEQLPETLCYHLNSSLTVRRSRSRRNRENGFLNGLRT